MIESTSATTLRPMKGKRGHCQAKLQRPRSSHHGGLEHCAALQGPLVDLRRLGQPHRPERHQRRQKQRPFRSVEASREGRLASGETRRPSRRLHRHAPGSRLFGTGRLPHYNSPFGLGGSGARSKWNMRIPRLPSCTVKSAGTWKSDADGSAR